MINKSVVAGALTAFLASFGTQAADPGQGVVNFKGTVIESPCGIAPESADQTIDFGQISKNHLSSGGISIQKDVNIKLVQCEASGLRKGVKVTFNGNTETGTKTELATAGLTGTAIALHGYGQQVSFGTPSEFIQLLNGDNTLHFISWVKQATGKSVAEGDFTATANFNLAYE